MKKLILIVFLILFFLYSLRKSANFFPERIANQKFCLVGTGSLFAASLQEQRVRGTASPAYKRLRRKRQRVSVLASKFIKSFAPCARGGVKPLRGRGQRVSASASKLIRSFVQTFLKVWLPAGPPEANRLVYTPPTWWAAAPPPEAKLSANSGAAGSFSIVPGGLNGVNSE